MEPKTPQLCNHLLFFVFNVLLLGHGEDGALKSLWFERDPGTENQESVHRESEDADDEKSDSKMADKNNTCQSCGNIDKQDKREVRKIMNSFGDTIGEKP